jgi:hypothetical protein
LLKDAAQSENDLVCLLPRQLMMPNSDDTPSVHSQSLIYKLITCDIDLDLLAPKFRVCRRFLAVNRATMPKTPIYKNCHSVRPKNKIRPAEHLLMSSPTSY